MNLAVPFSLFPLALLCPPLFSSPFPLKGYFHLLRGFKVRNQSKSNRGIAQRLRPHVQICFFVLLGSALLHLSALYCLVSFENNFDQLIIILSLY